VKPTFTFTVKQEFLVGLTLKMNTLHLLKTSGTIYPATPPHNPEDLLLQQYSYKNPRSLKKWTDHCASLAVG
jgi:hypothetical protein